MVQGTTSSVMDARVRWISFKAMVTPDNFIVHGAEIGKESNQPWIASCLKCGNFGPEGHECAYCWTRMKCSDQEEKPITVIDELKYYLKNRLTSWQTVHDKFKWYLVYQDMLWILYERRSYGK